MLNLDDLDIDRVTKEVTEMCIRENKKYDRVKKNIVEKISVFADEMENGSFYTQYGVEMIPDERENEMEIIAVHVFDDALKTWYDAEIRRNNDISDEYVFAEITTSQNRDYHSEFNTYCSKFLDDADELSSSEFIDGLNECKKYVTKMNNVMGALSGDESKDFCYDYTTYFAHHKEFGPFIPDGKDCTNEKFKRKMSSYKRI